MPADFNVGVYGQEIHEMSEMAAVPFGQYAQSNQPVHHVLYLFALAGRPDRTRYWVRQGNAGVLHPASSSRAMKTPAPWPPGTSSAVSAFTLPAPANRTTPSAALLSSRNTPPTQRQVAGDRKRDLGRKRFG